MNIPIADRAISPQVQRNSRCKARNSMAAIEAVSNWMMHAPHAPAVKSQLRGFAIHRIKGGLVEAI